MILILDLSRPKCPNAISALIQQEQKQLNLHLEELRNKTQVNRSKLEQYQREKAQREFQKVSSDLF